MVRQQKFGANWKKILVVLGIPLSLAGCSVLTPEPKVVTVTDVQQIQIPTVARPKPINLTDTRIYVVNQNNLEEFLQEFEDVNGNRAFVALSIKDYENLSLNIAELRRYIKQQGEIIVYYEEAVTPNE